MPWQLPEQCEAHLQHLSFPGGLGPTVSILPLSQEEGQVHRKGVSRGKSPAAAAHSRHCTDPLSDRDRPCVPADTRSLAHGATKAHYRDLSMSHEDAGVRAVDLRAGFQTP